MKILITGGCGFLGSNLASFFLRQGWEVVVLDALFRVGSEANLLWLESQAQPRQFHHYKADTACLEAVEECFRREGPFHYICHLAGQVAMTTSLQNPIRDMLTNVNGTVHVLECARRQSPQALVAFSSTNKVYGDLAHIRILEKETRYDAPDYPQGFNEDLPLDFASPYGCSKGAADQYVRDWFRNYGLPTVVFRHSSIYGGRQFATYDQGWVGWFCAQALRQQKEWARGQPPEPFTIAGTGKQVRDVLHAEDLVSLYSVAFENKEAAAGKIFNIGGGIPNSLSLLELFRMLENLLDLPAPLAFVKTPRRQSDQDWFVADNTRASKTLGWSPQVSCAKGIQRMLAWAQEQTTL